jgi:tetratricopeptide (TPR) repeat protein
MGRRVSPVRWLRRLILLGTTALAGWAWWSRAGHPPDLLARARAAYDREDWEAANELARQHLKVARADRDGLRLLARASIRLGSDTAALSTYARLPATDMQVEDLCLLGGSLTREGKRTSAMKVWEDARSRDPGHAETLFELTRAYLAADRLDDAARAAADLAVRPGWESRAEALLGAIRLERNDPAGAVEDWRRALGRPRPTVRAGGVPAPIVPRTEFARALLRVGRPDEAREQLRIVLAGTPDDEAFWLLSRVDLQHQDWTAARADLSRSGSFRDDHPLQAEPSPYVGTSRCDGCHAAQFQAQQASRHARTFFRATELGGLELPAGPVPDPADPSVVHALRRDADGRIHQETKASGRVLRAVVQYAFGSGDRGLTFVGRDPDGRAYEMRLSDYPEVHGEGRGARAPARWDRTSGHPPHPTRVEEYLGQPLPESGVRRCLLCHVTDPRAIVEGTGACASDRSIGCERCHGPGGNHLLAVEGKLVEVDPAIARPTLASGARVVQLCAECHSPRGQEVSREDPTAVRFQGTTLTWSRCFSESGDALDCITCHDPHRNASTSTAHYEARCLECHSGKVGQTSTIGRAVSDRRSSRRRALRDAPGRSTCPVNPTSGCIGCHMPAVTGVVPHSTFTDHFIRVHRD